MAKSKYLASLTAEQRTALVRGLLEQQGAMCFICDEQIDPVLQESALDIDHVVPLDADGGDHNQNLALTHASCNRSKGASNLQVARRLKAFEKMQEKAKDAGERGVNLGHVLKEHGGSQHEFRIESSSGEVRYSLAAVGDNAIRSVSVHHDRLSGMRSFFVALPIEYLHHDDRINPRDIGPNLRRLLEEFEMKRPQLQVSLGWWAPHSDSTGIVRVFDGQHKAAAQILLGVRELPVRVFLDPDTDVLLQANTNAGGKLKQIAFDTAVMHHLGSSLYSERLSQYRAKRGLAETDLAFSEQDLLNFFRGEKREVLKYILDKQKDDIIRAEENRLRQFIEWAGKGSDLPLSYSAVDRTFFKVFLHKKPLPTRIDDGWDAGENPRQLELQQLIRIMNIYADVAFVDKWDPDVGGRRLETRIQKGDDIPDLHLRAWRLAREEALANILVWVRGVITTFNVFHGRVIPDDRVLHQKLPEDAWSRVEDFLRNLAELPCWIDHGMSGTIFGSKQNLDFWETIFDTGKAPTGLRVLAAPLNINEMISPHPEQLGTASD